MTNRFAVNALPIFIFPSVLHISDILFTLIGGFTEILWIILLASAFQTAFLIYAWLRSRKFPFEVPI